MFLFSLLRYMGAVWHCVPTLVTVDGTFIFGVAKMYVCMSTAGNRVLQNSAASRFRSDKIGNNKHHLRLV